MKIDRRCFLSLGIGAAAGTVLSPLPWKITDDLSIWTQMWPWVPVPEHGEVSYVDSVSSLCSSGCGIRVRKVDERAVKIEGRADYPASNGGLCILCEAGLQKLYGPTRIQAPLKRVGERGAGSWKTVTWDEALGELVGNLKGIREAGAPETLACIAGSGRGTVPALFQRLLTAFGSPNFLRPATMEDGYRAAMRLVYGADAVPGFDVENADFVLSFGCGILEGWGATVRMFQAHSGWQEKGVKFVQAEPRLSSTAAKADLWLPINPGTEPLLALALAHVIIKESLYDYGFVNGGISGFDGFQSFVMDRYAPAQVAEAIGVDAAAITALAQDFARSKHPLALCGRGDGESVGSLSQYVSVHILNALVGNINRPGGVWTLPEMNYIQWADPTVDDVAQAGLEKPRIDAAGPYADHLLNRLPKVVAENGGIETLLVVGANPLYSAQDPGAMAAAFEKIPFVVSFADHMNETAAAADLILPVHSHLERWEDVPEPAAFGRPVIGLARPVVDVQFDTRHPGDICIRIAQALEGSVAESFPWDSYEACLKETLGDRWAGLEESGFWQDDTFKPGKAASWFEALVGPSIRMELASDVVDLGTLFETAAPEGDAGTYPLVLVAYDAMRISGGDVGTPPFLMKTVPDTVLKGNMSLVEINPQTAAGLGLKAGDEAVLTTPKSSAKVRLHLFDGIRPGVIALPRGLGHTAYSKFLAGKGVNVNELIGSVEDPTTGLDAAWGVRAALAKA